MKKDNQNYIIWIEAEEWASGWKPDDANSDVIVTWADGRRWVASFISYKNVQTLTQKNKSTGECLSGAYFWASDMLLIDTVSRQRIEEVIDHLIRENEFETVFIELPREEVQDCNFGV